MLPARHQHLGPLLIGIVKGTKGDFAKIGKASPKSGHLYINGKRLLAKHSSASSSSWTFSFSPEDLRTLAADHADVGLFGSYACLICGDNAICVLRSDEVFELLDVTKQKKSQTIRVHKRAGCCLRVSSPSGNHQHVIPANRFPALLTSK